MTHLKKSEYCTQWQVQCDSVIQESKNTMKQVMRYFVALNRSIMFS